MTNFLCFVIALHVVSFANLYVIKNLNLKYFYKVKWPANGNSYVIADIAQLSQG